MSALGSDFAFAHLQAGVDNQNLLDISNWIVCEQFCLINDIWTCVSFERIIVLLRFALPLIFFLQGIVYKLIVLLVSFRLCLLGFLGSRHCVVVSPGEPKKEANSTSLGGIRRLGESLRSPVVSRLLFFLHTGSPHKLLFAHRRAHGRGLRAIA